MDAIVIHKNGDQTRITLDGKNRFQALRAFLQVGEKAIVRDKEFNQEYELRHQFRRDPYFGPNVWDREPERSTSGLEYYLSIVGTQTRRNREIGEEYSQGE
jgi:hypothetical protein